jgi:hypothetical protein
MQKLVPASLSPAARGEPDSHRMNMTLLTNWRAGRLFTP